MKTAASWVIGMLVAVYGYGTTWTQVGYPPDTPWSFAVLSGHTTTIKAIAFSPKGDLLATGESRNVFRIWDTSTWREIWTLIVPPVDPTLGTTCSDVSLAWNPDGKLLALGGTNYGDPVYLLNVVSHELRVFPTGKGARTRDLAFSPDGSLLVGSFIPLGTIVWDVATGEVIKFLPVAWELDFTPDGDYLVAAVPKGTDGAEVLSPCIVLWSVKTWTEAKVLEGLWGPFAISPCGRFLAAMQGFKGPVVFVEMDAGKPIAWLKEDISAHGISGYELAAPIAFSPDGEDLMFVGRDGLLRLWKWTTGDVSTIALRVSRASFSPDGSLLATVAPGSLTVELWDTTTFELVWQLPGQELPVEWTDLSISSDGTILVSPARSRIFFWDLLTGTPKGSLRFSFLVGPVAYNPAKDIIAVGSLSYQAVISVVDVRTMNEILVLEGHQNGVLSLGFSPLGDRLVSGGTDGLIRVWDILKQTEKMSFSMGACQAVISIAFHPDGRHLAAASFLWMHSTIPPKFLSDLMTAPKETKVAMWDLETGECQFVIEGGSGPLTFSPDGNCLAMAHPEGVKIIEVGTGAQLASFDAPGEAPLLFTPDGQYLITRSKEGKVRLWSFLDGKLIREIPTKGATAVVLEMQRGIIYTALGDLSFPPRGVNLSALLAWYIGDLLGHH